MSSPAVVPSASRPGRYALLTILAIPAAAVALWIVVLIIAGGSGGAGASVWTAVCFAAPVAAAIWLGVRERIKVWLIVVACVGAVLIWIPLLVVAFAIGDAIDGDGGSYAPVGVISTTV